MKSRLASLAVILCLASSGLQAQTSPLQPGLWEISSRNMEIGGQQLPEVSEMLAGMPAEQRQMMERMLKERGVELGNQSVRICLTEAQLRASELPLQDPRSGCEQRITERSGNTWQFRFDCPEARGQGEVRFLGPREFVTRVESTFQAGGQTQSGSMETQGRWIQADCANQRPVQ